MKRIYCDLCHKLMTENLVSHYCLKDVTVFVSVNGGMDLCRACIAKVILQGEEAPVSSMLDSVSAAVSVSDSTQKADGTEGITANKCCPVCGEDIRDCRDED